MNRRFHQRLFFLLVPVAEATRDKVIPLHIEIAQRTTMRFQRVFHGERIWVSEVDSTGWISGANEFAVFPHNCAAMLAHVDQPNLFACCEIEVDYVFLMPTHQ